nr:spatacsin [Leptinotarsa decemlineata]
MASKDNHVRNRPPPPRNVSKEIVGVWTGWCCKGDKEVAREAAAKGIHVDLVIQFLALRRNVTIEEAQNYFRDEVFKWVKELLDRKQIFRVSHILKNIGVDPQEELSKVFYKTTNVELREYIGNHLVTQNGLEEHLKQLWKFLDLISRNNLLISKYKLPEDSVECLHQQKSEWKSDIAAKLFLRTHDISLSPFLTGEALWKQLLVYNDIKLLKIWINLKFSDKLTSFDISENLSSFFHSHSITNEMINQLNASETAANTTNAILNELSRFGIFCDAEINSFLNVLSRLNQSESTKKVFRIIRKSTANLTEQQFLNLLVDYCTTNKLGGVLSICVENFDISHPDVTRSTDLDLIYNFRGLTRNFNQDNLCDNILKVSRYLSSDLETYYTDNPMILLALIFFTKTDDFFDILSKKRVIVSDVELNESVVNLPLSLKTLGATVNRKTIVEKGSLTFYDLLEKHYKIDVRKLFSFRFERTKLPHFGSENLIAKHGYSKQLNYQFYLKQFRPSMACKWYLIDQYQQYDCIPEANVRQLQKKVYKIALRNLNNVETGSSCVAFLEMIGISSNYLKVALGAASIVYEHCRSLETVIELFMNVENNPEAITETLETIVMEEIDVERFTEGSYFVQSMNLYDIVVNFTVSFNLKLPEMFLRACASNNMWLPLLIFAQLKNYPLEQIKPIVQSFKNPTLHEHIYHSVLHDILVDDQNVWLRDSRTTYLSRIGLRKSMDNLSQSGSVYSSLASQSSYGSNASSGGSDSLEIDIANTKATLLQTLIRCHNSTDPPRALLQACQLYRNPLLAIFATSYEPDSVITNWLTWLAVSSELYETFTNFESVALCAQDVSNLMENCMKYGYPKTLLQSFKIFIPANPLKHFLEFLNVCINKNFDKTVLVSKVNAFSNSLHKCRRYSVLSSETDHEMTYLNNKIWLKTMALRLLSLAIEYNVKSLYEQIELLKSLCEIELEACLKCPELKSLLEILQIVYDSKCPQRFDIVLFFDERNGRKAVVDCLEALVGASLFEHALKLARTEKLPADLILIKQWQHNYEHRRQEDSDFWQRADEQFKVENVTADCVIEFYLSYLDKVESGLEKYQLLKLSYEWARGFELSSRFDLEKRKWLAYVALEDKWRSDSDLLDEVVENMSFKEITSLLKRVTKYDGELSAAVSASLKAMVNDALNVGNLWLALKIEKIFGCGNASLEILKLCFSLAEGLILPYQLNTEQRLLLAKGSQLRRLGHRRGVLSSRMSGLSGSHSSTGSTYLSQLDYTDSSVQDTLATLCMLAEKLTAGIEMGQAVFMTYRISLNIEIPYHLVVSTGDSMKMLKDALEDDCLNKLEVVHDFFCVYKWSKEQMADFICEEIINAVTKFVQSKSEPYTMWDLKLDQEFPMVLQLLQENCSVLGYKIYAYASAIHKSQVLADLDFRISELALVIELLVISHDCFTADCNMEGISIILKKCQAVISHLLTLRSWKLIVRLFTGVGRYTEMNYVFQILRENDQFEFLLRKGSRKDNGLKAALLEYLKKYCPDNKELYKIVGLHFTLFSEVALLWEREAQSVIRNLIDISRFEMQNNRINPDAEPFILFSNTDGTRICLNKALENYTHATEFHLQGEKLAKAMNAAKQAELIALQMSLLKSLPVNKSAVCLLNLNQAQVVSLISNELSFDQTLILTQAYNYQPDWSSVLFEQCVIKNNLSYLQSYMKHLSLTDNNVVHDISRKFLAANLNGYEEINSMKSILHKLPSVHVKYRIASELGFTDMVEDLIQGGQLAYLKDTVWKKGYKS